MTHLSPFLLIALLIVGALQGGWERGRVCEAERSSLSRAGWAGARARDVRRSCTARDRAINGLDAGAKRRREAHFRTGFFLCRCLLSVICSLLSFDFGAPPLGADGSEAGAEVCKRRDPKGAGWVGPAQHPPPYCADNILRKRALPLWEFRLMEGGAREGVSKGGGLARRLPLPLLRGAGGGLTRRRVCGAIHPASPEASAIPCPCLCHSHWRCHSPLSSLTPHAVTHGPSHADGTCYALPSSP